MASYALEDFGGRFLTTDRVAAGDNTYPGISAYVEWFVPQHARPISITLVHGGGGQSSEFLRTPDNRPGWVHAFLDAGFPVYLLDRPGHGRSQWIPEVLGPATGFPPYELLYPRFVEPARAQLWDEADKHSAWPDDEGAGERFMASQGVMATTLEAAQAHVEAISDALFALTGPTLLLSHSAGGPCGWALTAMGGELVEGVVAVEPLGFPGMEHANGCFSNGLVAKEFLGESDPYDRPIVVITGEATWMRSANAKLVEYLEDRGSPVEHFRLEDFGLFGNGHMMMSEKNSEEIAALIINWICNTIPGVKPDDVGAA